MPLEIRKVNKETTWRRFAFYGEGGVGKSWLAASANHDERMAPALIIAAGEETDALETMENPPPYVSCKEDTGRWNPKIVEEVFWALAGKSAEFKDFRTIIWDSYSESYQSQLQYEALSRAKKQVWDTPETLSQYEYVQANRKMRDLVSKLCDLDRHVIVTCHAVRDDDDKRFRFAVSPGARLALENKVQIGGYLAWYRLPAKEGELEPKSVRTLFTVEDNPGYWAKSRALGQNIRNMPNPTMTKILDAMMGKKGGE